MVNQYWEELLSKAKSFLISKHAVWSAYKRVKANKGAAGCDYQSMTDFEKDLKDNLYRIWDRMSSDCYFPPPVLRVEIPKGDGKIRPLGIPQGGGISPLLANLFLHYAFDVWLSRNFPNNPFERYADDGIIHCRTEGEAKNILDALKTRMKNCALELHPDKTKIVYCKDDKRKGFAEVTQFDFLGFTFRIRTVRNRHTGALFNGFCPAISLKSQQKIRNEIKSWKIYKRSDLSIFDMASFCNPKIRGWIQYYGKFYRSSLYRIFREFNMTLFHWGSQKYKKIRGSKRRFFKWLKNFAEVYPNLFELWKLKGVRVSTVQ